MSVPKNRSWKSKDIAGTHYTHIWLLLLLLLLLLLCLIPQKAAKRSNKMRHCTRLGRSADRAGIATNAWPSIVKSRLREFLRWWIWLRVWPWHRHSCLPACSNGTTVADCRYCANCWNTFLQSGGNMSSRRRETTEDNNTAQDARINKQRRGKNYTTATATTTTTRGTRSAEYKTKAWRNKL